MTPLGSRSEARLYSTTEQARSATPTILSPSFLIFSPPLPSPSSPTRASQTPTTHRSPRSRRPAPACLLGLAARGPCRPDAASSAAAPTARSAHPGSPVPAAPTPGLDRLAAAAAERRARSGRAKGKPSNRLPGCCAGSREEWSDCGS